MPSTYSSLKIQLMATGENTTTWGDVTNTNLGTAIEEAIVGSADVTFASGNVTLTLSDTNNTQTARNMRLRCTGTTGGSTRNLVVPSIEKPYIVQNDCADSIVVKTAAGSGVTVPAGKTSWVYSNGTNVVDVVTHLTSLTLGSPLAVAQGGTGSTTSTGSGAVVLATSPTLVTPNIGTPSAGVLTNCTGLPLATGTTGTLAVANGGTGVTTSTGSGSVVLATSPTLVTPNLGTPSAVTLTNGTGLPIVAGTTGTLTVARGGTGATSLTSGYLVKGNGTSAASASIIYDDGTNVGIGTNSPTTKLTVTNSTAIDTRLTLGNSISAVQIGVEAAGAAFFGAVNNYSLYFLTNNTERFRIGATGGITSSNLADAVGYKGLPLNSQTASYTLALTDMGKLISITTGGVVIPANASVAFPVGSAVVVYNDSASTQTISITSDTLRQSGTTNTGSRTLAAYGVATLTKVASTTWVVSGNVS